MSILLYIVLVFVFTAIRIWAKAVKAANRRQVSQAVIVQATKVDQPSQPVLSLADELKKLADLREAGGLSYREFIAKRSALLKS